MWMRHPKHPQLGVCEVTERAFTYVWRARGWVEADRPPRPILPEHVPPGSIADVLTWVGDDPARTRAALQVETDRPNPRKTLVSALQGVAGGNPEREE